MSLPLKQIEAEVLERPVEERAHLARLLIASLDDEPAADQAEVERAWEEEVYRRLEEFRAGSVEAIPAETVLAKARRELR
jgi:putative addiction module component (TIGR02574 family)